MSNEKMRILEMIQTGKLTANEGLDLLNAMEDTGDKPAKGSPRSGDGSCGYGSTGKRE